jgi:hypothetical protein
VVFWHDSRKKFSLSQFHINWLRSTATDSSSTQEVCDSTSLYFGSNMIDGHLLKQAASAVSFAYTVMRAAVA